MSLSNNLGGVVTALITPFEHGKIDWNSFDRLLDDQLEQDLDGFVVNGTTGESPTLELEEVKQLVEHTRKKLSSSGRERCLIVGTGSNSTKKTIEMTKHAEDMGADAALVVTPYYNKPPQRGLLQHFKTVAESVNLPLLLYNVPGRTMTEIQLDTLKELSQVPNIVGVKEASGNMEFGERLLQSVHSDFLVTSGDDGTCLRLALKGGRGVISVCSHIIGAPMKEFFELAFQGKFEADTKFEAYQNFISHLYLESNPIPVKMALFLKGVIKSPELRLPLVRMSAEAAEKLKKSMQSLGLIS